MHAHRTLRRWADTIAQPIVQAATAELLIERVPAARARLVDLLGVVADDTDGVLLHLDARSDEPLRFVQRRSLRSAYRR